MQSCGDKIDIANDTGGAHVPQRVALHLFAYLELRLIERVRISLGLQEVVPVRGIGGIGRNVKAAIKHGVRDERLVGTIPWEAPYSRPV